MDSNIRIDILKKLIARDRGEDVAQLFAQYQAHDLNPIMDLGRELLEHTPIYHGACAAMSAGWAALSRDRLQIPAVAVAGDLLIEGNPVFLCDGNIPESTGTSDMTPWDGHCWIEIAGVIGDASIFRTARTIDRPSRLKAFIDSKFGLHRGLLLCSHSDLMNMGVTHVPKYVLTETQINGLLAGLRDKVQRGTN